MLNSKNEKNLKINCLIILSFVIISFFTSLFLLHFGHIYNIAGDDMQFHLNRMASIMRDGMLTKYALSSFSNNGSAVMTMYPYLFIYPLAIIFHLVHSIFLSIVIMYSINILALLNICYFSSLHFSKDRYLSYIFSILYAVSSYLFIVNLQTFDIGMTYSYIFMPLILFGFIYWLNENKWLMLSIGATLIIFSNILMAAITPIILLAYMLIEFKKVNFNKIIQLIKAVILALSVSAIFWIPAIKLYLQNKLRLPHWPNIAAIGLRHLVTFPLIGFTGDPLTISSFLGIVVGIFLFRHFSSQLKHFYIISICILILCTNKIPWNPLFNHTFIRIIQYSGRLIFIPQTIFIYMLAAGLAIIFKNVQVQKKLIMVCSLVVLIVAYQFIFQDISTKGINSGGNQTPYATAKNTLNRVDDISNTDYYPKTSIRYKKELINDKGIAIFTNSRNKDKSIKFKAEGQGNFKFNAPYNTKEVVIPFLHYNGTEYSNELDSRPISVTENKDQLLTLHNVKKGYHSYQVKICTPKSTIFSEIITIIGVLLLICCSLYKNKKSLSI